MGKTPDLINQPPHRKNNMSQELKIHPYATVFPEASAEDYQSLKQSMNKHGQRIPIVLLGGEVLDGRTRYRAARELKIPPQFRQYCPVKDGPDPILWVMDQNLHRRHLTTGQKAAVAVELEKMIKQVQEQAEAANQAGKLKKTPTSNDPDPTDQETLVVDETKHPTALEQAAKQAGVSPRSVQDAKYLDKHDPERLDAVKSGKTSLHAATEASKADAAKKQTEPSLLDGKKDIVNPYRSECADLMASSHGDKFADAVRNDTILRDKELREFMKLAIQDQQQITGMVARGWKVREAVKFAKGIFEKDDPIRDLLNLCIMRKGQAVAKLDGHTILILDGPALEASKGEFVKLFIDSILEEQQKPESKKPPINTVGQAMEKAKPADKPADKPGKSSRPAPSSPVSKVATPKGAAGSKPKGKK
jgi:hypothetical protein